MKSTFLSTCGMYCFFQWCTWTPVIIFCFRSIFGREDHSNILMCAISILDLRCYGSSRAHILSLAPPIAWTLRNKRVLIVLMCTTHNWFRQRSTMTFWSICLKVHMLCEHLSPCWLISILIYDFSSKKIDTPWERLILDGSFIKLDINIEGNF